MTLTELNEIKANYKILEIAVDFINPSYNISRAKHLDNARYLICTLTENGIPRMVKVNEAARIRLQKPDKTYVYNDCDVIEDGRVFITLTEQILAAEGNAVCDIQLTDEETGIIYSSKNFIINIDKTAVNNSIMESTNEFNALNNLIATNKKLNDTLEANEDVRQANEEKRIEDETTRQENETDRKNSEAERTNAENIRITNENERIANENIRQTNENIRQEHETYRENNTSVAVSNAEAATKKANDAADDLQNKLNSHHFVLTEDKDIANGVPSLDSNTKIPINELYEATTTSKGITQLTDSVESTSTSTAATPNSVKIAYDKAASVENDINANRENWNDKYTKNEVDNKFSTIETNVDWKESVETYNDILTAYPNPDDGWTVNVKDTDYTYRFNGTEWVAISANAIPKATNNVDGLLSKEDKTNYDDANTKKHTHDNKSIIDKITQTLLDAWNAAYTHITDAVKHITGQERSNWNEAYTHSKSAHAPDNAEVNQNAFSNIAIDSTTIAADSKTDTLTLLAGDNITLSPDTENNQITISSTGGTISNALPLSGGNMTGNIGFKGTKATIDMIKFIDNTSDANGNGISIGGGGLTIIGGGESSNKFETEYSSGGSENMVIANDGTIDFYTNCQNGISSAKHITMNTDGSITATAFNGNSTTATTAARALSLQLASNEMNFVKPDWTTPKNIHFGYRWTDGTTEDLIAAYYFDNGNRGLAAVTASRFIGNADSATKLQTTRNVKIGSETHTFDGSSDIVFTAANMGLATASHTHNYLPLTGGTVTGTTKFGTTDTSGSYIAGNVISTRGNCQLYFHQAGEITSTSGAYGFHFTEGSSYNSDYVLSIYKGAYYSNNTRMLIYSSSGKCHHFSANPSLAGNYLIYLPTGSGTLSIASSDIRLKENIKDTEVTDALSLVNSIKFRQFDWKETGKHQKIGFVVDELEKLDEHLKLENTGGYTREDLTDEEKNNIENMNVKCVDTFYLMGYYGKAIQELSALIEEQQNKINELKTMIL